MRARGGAGQGRAGRGQRAVRGRGCSPQPASGAGSRGAGAPSPPLGFAALLGGALCAAVLRSVPWSCPRSVPAVPGDISHLPEAITPGRGAPGPTAGGWEGAAVGTVLHAGEGGSELGLCSSTPLRASPRLCSELMPSRKKPLPPHCQHIPLWPLSQTG